MEEEIGRITHFFSKISVGVLELTKGELRVGDTIHIKGHTTDLELVVNSMQIDNNNVTEAKKGQSVGIKVPDRVRAGDSVYIIT